MTEPLPVLQLLLDGAADRSQPILQERTPLQAAQTPHLDRLAAGGMGGLMDVGPPGRPFHSPAAHALLWGVPPERIPVRSLLEATGAGVDLDRFDLLFYFYLAAGEARPDGFQVTDRIPTYDGEDELAKLYGRDRTLTVGDWAWRLEFHSVEERPNSGLCGVQLVEGLVPDELRLTDSDPFQDDFPLIEPELIRVVPDEEPYSGVARSYVRLIRRLMRESLDRLADHPAYDVMAPKWHTVVGGRNLPLFEDCWGMKPFTDSTKEGVVGTARLLGFEWQAPPPETSFETRVLSALDRLDGYDFVHCHFPEPDGFGHANDPEGKRDVLEAIDRALEPVIDRRGEMIVCVTSDHPTPCGPLGEHGGGTVPVLLHGPETRVDDVDRFDEVAAGRGALGHIRGRTLMPRLVDMSRRGIMHEVTRHPSQPVYRMAPDEVRPFSPEGP